VAAKDAVRAAKRAVPEAEELEWLVRADSGQRIGVQAWAGRDLWSIVPGRHQTRPAILDEELIPLRASGNRGISSTKEECKHDP
jgi:hypothetical protein